MLLAPLLLLAALSSPRDAAHEFIAAFETADVARLDALWSERSPRRLRDRKRLRLLALDPRSVATFSFEEQRICLDVREPGGALVEQYELELRRDDDGRWRLWSAQSVGAMPIPRARDLIHRGMESLTEGALDAAVAAFTAAADLAATHPPTRATALHGLGHIAFVRIDLDTAARHFQQSLDLARAAGHWSGIGLALEGLAGVDRMKGDLDRAESRLAEALVNFDVAGDRVWVALTLGSQGHLRQARGDFRGAWRLHRDALARAEELGHPGVLLFTTVNLGVNARLRGDYRESAALLVRARELSEVEGSPLGLANAMANLGATLAAQGNLSQAVQAFHEGLALKERLGRGESIILELSHLGEMYRRLGNYEQAAAQFEKALAWAQRANFRIEIARGHYNLGQLERERGDPRAAIALYEKALAIDRELGNRAGIARDLLAIGQAQLAAGGRAAARLTFEQSLAIAEELDARESMTLSLAMLAGLAESPERAIAQAERAIGLATDLGLPEHLWYAHLALARAYRRAQRTRDARVALERAVTVVEAIRRGVPGEEAAQQVFARLVEPYHELIALLVEQGDAAGALEYAERAKARVLLDVLHEGRPDLGSVLTDAEREREAELTAAIAERNRTHGVSKELREARLAYDAFLTSIYARYPQLRSERGEVTPLRATDLGTLDPFVEFVVTAERTFVFTATRVETIDVTERELAAEVKRFRELLASHDLAYQPAARALYDRLLRRVVPELHGAKTLCIVPDGPLWELPFHALQPSNGEFLLDRHAVYYAPSLSVLREMSKRSPAPRAATLLAFGNPTSSETPLPHTETEIRAIASLYGANNSIVRLRGEAREELVKSEAGRFDVLHFATHGILDDENGLYSRLVFSPPATKSDDGFLEAREIMRLDLRARLAVLSACETARGRVSSGEGLIGMSWALFVAGVPATVVSQWKVDSASTSALMIEFHRNLRAGLGNAEALRRAALKTRANRAWWHPFHWAPFVVVGSAR